MKKNKKNFLKINKISVITFIFSIMMTTTSWASPYSKIPAAWKELFSEYRILLAGIAGLGALTSILVFIIHAMQLASNADNPTKRSYCIRGIAISGIVTALLGGISLVLTIFYGIFV